jgi:hypothetical protein
MFFLGAPGSIFSRRASVDKWSKGPEQLLLVPSSDFRKPDQSDVFRKDLKNRPKRTSN